MILTTQTAARFIAASEVQRVIAGLVIIQFVLDYISQNSKSPQKGIYITKEREGLIFLMIAES